MEQCHRYYEPKAKVDKVQLTLYFESLCPDCKNFFRSQLTKTYTALSDIINLTLVPYGNARVCIPKIIMHTTINIQKIKRNLFWNDSLSQN